jgi:hypothetical protein
MTTITATRPKQCTECKKEVVVRQIDHGTTETNLLTVTTVCEGCGIEYTSTFRKAAHQHR